MSQPDVEIPDSGKIILSSDEDDMEDMEAMLDKPLNSFGVQHGTIMVAEDFQVPYTYYFTLGEPYHLIITLKHRKIAF